MLRSPTHRLFAVAALVAAAFAISCGPDITGPSHGGARYARGVSFQPVFPALASQAADAGLVPFTHVHIVLHHADGTIALDTIVDFPPDATELTLSLDVPLAASAPPTGEPLSLNLAYVNAAGVTVFEGGPFPIVAVPSVAGAPPPPPVSVPVTYTGPGSTATSVVISPRTLSVFAGDAFGFTATAFDASGAPMPGTPIVFSSSNGALAPLGSPSSGSGTAAVGRGTSTITAQLLTGPSDVATLTVQPRPSAIAAVSGSGQTAQVGAALASPAVAQVSATDGLGVAGVTVSFSASGGGIVSPTSAVTDATGQAQASWTLGVGAGAQTLTATAAGVSAAATFSATATPKPAAKLVFTTQPSNAQVGASIGTIAISVLDASNNVATAFSGPVSIGLGTNPGGASVAGATTVNAVGGVATFSGLSLNKIGVGYTLVASSGTLAGATSSAFNIDPGAATRVEFTTQPANAVAGTALPPIQVSVRDITGNLVTTYTGAVQLSLASNPVGGQLNGTSSVNAVSGVATFSGLSLNKTGTGYTLRAVSSALGSEISSGFNITAAAPATCTIGGGNNQTAPAGSALAPIFIAVADAFGNGVPGAAVTAVVVSGGGSVAPTTASADATGTAGFTWTLGATLGPQALTASCTGVAGAVALGATATTGVAGPATQLAFTVQPSNVTAGTPDAPAIVVTAKDAVGLTATTFTGNVTLTLATNPGGSTLGGALTVAAVAGVATFNNVHLNKIGAGYTLNATSGVLTAALSGAFNVTAAPPVAIIADSGDFQSGPVSAPLAQQLVARVLDSLGNPVAGINVTLAVTTGGGSLAPTGVVVTDVNGRVRTTWTLGATGGAQTVTATSVGLGGSPLTFTATGTGAPISLNWTGAIDGTWTTAGNWSPAQVPTAVDSVTIGSTANNPSITAPVTVHSFVMTGCFSMNNSSTLTITGTYVDNSNSCLRASPTKSASPRIAKDVSGTGTVILSGTGDLMGALSASSIQITGGVHSLVGVTNFNGPTTVSGTAVLNIGGASMFFGSDFTTTGSGVMQEQSVNAFVVISGNATFSGGSESGLLTDGVIQVLGDFTASGTKFDGSGTHNLQMMSCNNPQNVDFTAPVAGRGIHNLEFGCTSAKSITGTPTVKGYAINNSSSPVTGPATVTILGDMLAANGASWDVANTVINTTTLQMMGPSFNTNLTIAGGTVQLQNDSFTALNGNVTVTGASSTFDINGCTFFMAGNFLTTNSGNLKMTDPSDLDFVLVAGNATFAGRSTNGFLTNGFIQIEGNFTQGGGAVDAYAASGTHQTEIGTQFFDGPFLRASAKSRAAGPRGGAAQSRLPGQVKTDAAPRLPNGINAKTAALVSRALAQASQSKARSVALRSTKASAAVQAAKAAAKAANPRVAAHAAMKARVQALIDRSPAAAKIKTSMNAALRARDFLPMTVSFANPGTGPGTSHFATGVMSTDEMDMATDVFMDGQLYADDDNIHVIAGNNNVLTSMGAEVFDFQFNNVRWVLTNGAEVFGLSNVTFMNMSPTVNQFTIQRSGTGLNGGIEPLFNFEFDTTPTTGNYISATDTDGIAPDMLFIDMELPIPSTSGGFIQLVNGATTNWLPNFDWTGLGASDSWDDVGNWSTGFVPGSNDDIVIKAGTPRDPLVDNGAGVFVRNLTIEAGKTINLIGNPVIAFGNVLAPITSDAVFCQDGGDFILLGNGGVNTINGRFCNAYIDGNYEVSGPNNQLITTNELVIEGTGNLSVNGGRVDVGGVGATGPGEFDTWDSATLTMTNPADQMFVGSIGAYFQGGSTAGLLTSGTLTVVDGCVHTFLGVGAADAFAPSGTHTVVFSGTTSNVEFGDPTMSYLQNAQIPGTSQLLMLTDASVHGTLTHTGTGAASIVASVPGTTLTTSGLSNSTQPLVISGLSIKLVDGTANTTFDNVTWIGFPAGFTGNVFDVNRSGAGTLTFNNHIFSAITLAAGGHYLVNRGTMNVHMATPTPSTVTTEILQLGTGTIIWP